MLTSTATSNKNLVENRRLKLESLLLIIKSQNPGVSRKSAWAAWGSGYVKFELYFFLSAPHWGQLFSPCTPKVWWLAGWRGITFLICISITVSACMVSGNSCFFCVGSSLIWIWMNRVIRGRVCFECISDLWWTMLPMALPSFGFQVELFNPFSSPQLFNFKQKMYHVDKPH